MITFIIGFTCGCLASAAVVQRDKLAPLFAQAVEKFKAWRASRKDA